MLLLAKTQVLFCCQCTLLAQVQFTVPRDFSPDLLPSSSVLLLNFLRLLLAYSSSLSPSLCMAGALPHIDWSLHFVVISKPESELCLHHQVLDKDFKRDTLMSSETLPELSVSFLKYFVKRWN